MKLWIVHDSSFGNGEKLAKTLGETLGKKMDVNIAHIKNILPEKVANDSPDVLIVGTAVRIFMISPASKKWLRKLKGQLNKNKKSIKYGISFVTHVLDSDKIKNKGNRFNESLKKGNVITNVYPEWIDGQVKTAEGPFKEGVIERIEKECKEISKWIKS